MYNIQFTSTNTYITALEFPELLAALAEHCANHGEDTQLIFITDSDSGEILEVIEGCHCLFDYPFYSRRLDTYLNILQMLEVTPYL